MDLQQAQQLLSDMQDLPTLTISTVSQFNLLPQADQEELLDMHKHNMLLQMAINNGVSVENYAHRILGILQDVQTAGAQRGYHYATAAEVEQHMTQITMNRMILGA